VTKSRYPQQQTYIPGRPILTYFRRLFVALDQVLNAVTGGSPDETLSSRFFNKDHCEKALEPDEGKISGKPTQKLTPKLYIINIGISLSQLLNVILGGDEDERLSSRAGKDARRGRKIACIFCRILHWIDRDHCEKAIERDEGKRPGQYDNPRRHARRTDYPPRSDWS